MKTQLYSSEYLTASLFFSASNIVSKQSVSAFLSSQTQALSTYSELLVAWKSHFPLMPFPEEEYWDIAEKWIERHTSEDIHLIDFKSSAYPQSLRLLGDPPHVLFLRGNPESILATPGVAIVGTRDASDAGKKIAHRIASHLGAHEWTVVSGLALGIDRAAHEGALSVNAKTIAVLAHGLHTATPRSNAQLADDILERGGSWVSEYPLGVPAQKHFFLARNRIQIGLSSGSIIVEADINSGSMAQARFCVGAKRPLFAVVPQEPTNNLKLNCQGTLQMVSQMGAFPIKSREDYDEMESKLLASKKNLMIEKIPS